MGNSRSGDNSNREEQWIRIVRRGFWETNKKQWSPRGMDWSPRHPPCSPITGCPGCESALYRQGWERRAAAFSREAPCGVQGWVWRTEPHGEWGRQTLGKERASWTKQSGEIQFVGDGAANDR